MQCISIEYLWQSIRIRSNKEITICILSVSVRIADICKISIHGYISAHLCRAQLQSLGWGGTRLVHDHFGTEGLTTSIQSNFGTHAKCRFSLYYFGTRGWTISVVFGPFRYIMKSDSKKTPNDICITDRQNRKRGKIKMDNKKTV